MQFPLSCVDSCFLWMLRIEFRSEGGAPRGTDRHDEEHSSFCATEQPSGAGPHSVPSIPPLEKAKWPQIRCLATAFESVKGRAYSHVRTSQRALSLSYLTANPQVEHGKTCSWSAYDICVSALSMTLRGIVD